MFSGLKFDIQTSSWSEILQNFKDKKLDIISGISYLKKREKFTLFSEPFFEIPIYIFGLKSNDKYKKTTYLKGKKVGINKDMYYKNDLIKLGIDVIEFKNSEEKMKALAFGNIDYVLASFSSGQKAITRLSLTNIKPLEEFKNIKKEDLRYGVIKNKILLYQIIQKSLKQILQNEYDLLVNKWIFNSIKVDVNTINLTQEEKQWIKNNTINIGISPWKPITYINNKTKEIDGISGDILNLIIRKVNLKTKVVSDNWSELLNDFKNHKIDILPSAYYTKQRATYGFFTKSHLNLKEYLYINSNSKIDNFSDLKGKKLAIIKSYGTIPKVKVKFPTIDIVQTESLEKSVQLVLEGKVDALYDTQFVVEDFISTHSVIGLKYIIQNDFKDSPIHFFSNKQKPILRSILQKSLDSITKSEKDNIIFKWVGLEKKQKDILSKDEKNYIKNKKTIKVCTDKEIIPFVIATNKGHKGISVDYLNQISKKTNLNFEILLTDTVDENYQKTKDGICDITTLVSTKYNLLEFVTPTVSYASDNIVLVTKIDQPYIPNLNDLANKKIAIHKGTKTLIGYVKSLYPNIQLIEIEELDLKRLVSGEFYGYIGPSYYFTYKIASNYSHDIKIMSKIGDVKLDGGFGIRNSEPLLLSIFNKAINDISDIEKRQIANSWLSVKVENKIDYSFIWQVIGVLFIIILIILIAYLKQIKLHNKIKILNDSLEIKVKEEIE
ncbi:MAG: transporter substrate-binding domain-containing protein, partial [Arcobacteraceae bacterium]|nr:transporter substrate-binding domain-containing protein [Arcobacteraceae bacterium]